MKRIGSMGGGGGVGGTVARLMTGAGGVGGAIAGGGGTGPNQVFVIKPDGSIEAVSSAELSRLTAAGADVGSAESTEGHAIRTEEGGVVRFYGPGTFHASAPATAQAEAPFGLSTSLQPRRAP